MSLSKEQSIEENYTRDSFSERICDDLCQHILQYLSLKDKLRLECVSKQFQRTAFISQRKLEINSEEGFSKKNFEILLKKLPCLNEINVNAISRTNPKLNKLYELVIKNCNNLTHFDCNSVFTSVDKDIQKKFFEKFGHNLMVAEVDSHNDLLWTLDVMPNIEELAVVSEYNQIPNIEFKRLKRFLFELRTDMDLSPFQVFIERNAKTITHLELFCYSESKKTRENFKLLFTIISKLKNLVHLRIRDLNFKDVIFNDNSFAKQLSQMAMNCNHLRSLAIDYDLDMSLDSSVDHFLPLKQFKRLKRLKLNLRKDVKNNPFFLFKAMKGFSELTHFGIEFPGEGVPDVPEVSDTIFTDIDINLPKLQSLTFDEIKVDANECTALILSRLTRLESITLCLTKEENITEIKSQLTQNCKRIRKIELVSYDINDPDSSE